MDGLGFTFLLRTSWVFFTLIPTTDSQSTSDFLFADGKVLVADQVS